MRPGRAPRPSCGQGPRRAPGRGVFDSARVSSARACGGHVPTLGWRSKPMTATENLRHPARIGGGHRRGHSSTANQATIDVIRVVARRTVGVCALLVISFRQEEVGRRHPLRLLGDFNHYRNWLVLVVGAGTEPFCRNARA